MNRRFIRFMKENTDGSWRSPGVPLTTELLLLPDGQILVHNLTPAFADLLKAFNPNDRQIAARAGRITNHESRSPRRSEAQAGITTHGLP